eukprot:6800910-Pyramimonas_sp.AAC.1
MNFEEEIPVGIPSVRVGYGGNSVGFALPPADAVRWGRPEEASDFRSATPHLPSAPVPSTKVVRYIFQSSGLRFRKGNGVEK